MGGVGLEVIAQFVRRDLNLVALSIRFKFVGEYVSLDTKSKNSDTSKLNSYYIY